MTATPIGGLFAAMEPCADHGRSAMPVSGLHYATEFLDENEEAVLIRSIDASNLSPFRFQQWTGKRVTRSYGWRYDFENASFGPTDPIPDWLLALKARAERFAGLPRGALVQALLIRYDAGAGIGWHKDRPVFEHVVGISLGRAGVLRLRRRMPRGFERRTLQLASRSIYHLSGEVRHEWEHSLLGEETVRWSITFRSLHR
jgi:alkylated DNA repair dioxygenase AlkB